MRYAKAEWESERNGWRSVVQLNVVRSIIAIQKIIEAEMNGDVPADSEDDQLSFDENNDDQVEVLKFTDRHQLLMIRLAPLLGVEAELKHRLGEGTLSLPSPLHHMSATPFDIPSGNQLRRKPEFSVRSWKDVVSRPTDPYPNDRDTVTSVLAGCKDDMKALWDDKAVRLALKRRRLQLPDSAGLYDSHLFTPTVLLINSHSFLNDLDRIASWEYTVTDNDIVRARLRTVGIQEYRLVFKHGPWDSPKSILSLFYSNDIYLTLIVADKHPGWEWHIFDVGGCRTLVGDQ